MRMSGSFGGEPGPGSDCDTSICHSYGEPSTVNRRVVR